MSNLSSFKSALETLWEAVTPASDGSTSLYRFIDDLIEERGNGRHRELIARLARRSDIRGEHEEQFEWSLQVELFLHRTPPGQAERTYEAFANAVEAEALDLALSFSRHTGWAASVLAPILDGFSISEREPPRPPGAGGVPKARVAVVTYNFRVLIQENG